MIQVVYLRIIVHIVRVIRSEGILNVWHVLFVPYFNVRCAETITRTPSCWLFLFPLHYGSLDFGSAGWHL